ncbi:MAG: ankyrin repeat domain-containing protein [PS1 clade bacterium]|uniref:Ankyrin repeat domain-containing protein n=1 Tax=PS1 clade bacterium TaxID=2175152 RepID=A0A937HMD4_9PROT|nr:ankyrin repeat domain-containing protein [PS1 clade bacterium]
MFNRLLKLNTQKFSLLPTTLLVLLALTLLANTAQAQACPNWNTREFFEKALPIDVAHCLDRGADAAARDWLGNTPLHYAAGNNETPAIIITLLEHGANSKIKNNDGKTALDLIDMDSPLRNTKAYWQLHEARYK